MFNIFNILLPARIDNIKINLWIG